MTFQISLSPVRMDAELTVFCAGDTMTINGVAYDFGPLPDGSTLPREAGTLTLFRGRNHFHAVTPVEGPARRVTAILTYDERPDCIGSERGNTFIYGPRVAEIYRRRREAAGAP